MRQKGMEMAIQIFIVLFVLLAVSMLVLQLVSQQFTEQQTKLQDVQRKAKLDQEISKNRSTCESLCNIGTEEKRAQFCIKSFSFAENSTLAKQNSEDFIAGVGVCEDKVYCPMLTTCRVGTETLDMANCKKVLCNYWTGMLGSKERATERLQQFIQPGACYDAEKEDSANHWFNVFFQGNLEC
ncbi:MAG: hypothetical protein QXZ13_02430 [Candidatus Diapherotrites archaeon]